MLSFKRTVTVVNNDVYLTTTLTSSGHQLAQVRIGAVVNTSQTARALMLNHTVGGVPFATLADRLGAVSLDDMDGYSWVAK